MEEEFKKAADLVKTKILDKEGLLTVYGLYKQATMGDNCSGRPSIFDPRGRAKWDGWESRKGMSQEDAMKSYVDFVNSL